MAVDTPRQLAGLQDVLCLVVDEAISLAYFVFSHNGSWLWSVNRKAKLTLANLALALSNKVLNLSVSSCHTFIMNT